MSGSVSSRIQYRGAVGELDIECVQIDHDDAMAILIHKRLQKDIAIIIIILLCLKSTVLSIVWKRGTGGRSQGGVETEAGGGGGSQHYPRYISIV